jgi:hypothetical protein
MPRRKRDEPAILDEISVEDEQIAPAIALIDQCLLVRSHQVLGLTRLAARIAGPLLEGHRSETEALEQALGGSTQLG